MYKYIFMFLTALLCNLNKSTETDSIDVYKAESTNATVKKTGQRRKMGSNLIRDKIWDKTGDEFWTNGCEITGIKHVLYVDRNTINVILQYLVKI